MSLKTISKPCTKCLINNIFKILNFKYVVYNFCCVNTREVSSSVYLTSVQYKVYGIDSFSSQTDNHKYICRNL